MDALRPHQLHQMALANERAPASQRIDPGYFADAEHATAPFDADWIESWICGLASAPDAEAYMVNDGVYLDQFEDALMPLMAALAKAYAEKQSALADLLGDAVFQAFKPLASAAFKSQ